MCVCVCVCVCVCAVPAPLAGGERKPSETHFFQAAVRELREETTLDVVGGGPFTWALGHEGQPIWRLREWRPASPTGAKDEVLFFVRYQE